MNQLLIPRRQLTADFLLLLAALFWGATFIIVKQAIEHVDVFVFLAQRFSLAFTILLPLCIMRWRQLTFGTILRGCTLGTFLFGAFALQTLGLQYTSASNAGFVTGLNVVLVPIFGLVLFRRSMHHNVLMGVALAAFGLFFLCTEGTWSLNKGDLLITLCAGCIALQILYTDRFARRDDIYWLTTLQLGTVAVYSATGAWVRGDDLFIWNREILWILLICTLFATVFAFLVQTSMQRFTSPTHTALIFCMEPVFGALFAYWLGHEKLGLWALFGATLIVAGMIFSELPVAKEVVSHDHLPSRDS